MPEKETLRRAAKDRREGKSPSTQAGEFVREEMHHIREGKHGARSAKQAIAIGLSKARRAGVPLKPQAKSAAKSSTSRRSASAGKSSETSKRRGRAALQKLKREPHAAASHLALSRHAHAVARRKAAR